MDDIFMENTEDDETSQFSWVKALFFGLLTWCTMFILGALVVTAQLGLGAWIMLILAAIAGLVSFGFATIATPESVGQAIGYGAVFAAFGLILDVLISRHLQPGLYAVWTYWLAYALVLLSPITAVSGHHHRTTIQPQS
ncbi:MAG: hypothetical protein P4L74_06590 [Candidatus Doudnabacteria bacterium]|nr:hypothetical protein [Candidatus Doudnabacteria bacterium]